MRARVATPVAVLAAALLAGCGGLSTSGPVRSGLEVGSGEDVELRQFFPGPQAGASQESVVLGFIRAGAASDGAYDTARRFLTASASESWNPDRTLVLQSGDDAPTVSQVDPATVALTVRVAGVVDGSGRYRAAVPGATVTSTFSLTSVNGEWRVDTLPEKFGRWIKRSDVSRLVQPYAIHYVSLSRRATVPDVRWFPLDRLSARLARAQLDPVPAFLEGAVVSAVPTGARLLGDAVSVENGVADVNLISSSLEPGQATRQNLWAQFVTTLTQAQDVTAVRLAVDGVPVDLDGVAGPVSSLSRVGFPAPAPDTSTTVPVVRRGSAIALFDPGVNAQEQGRQAGPRASDYPAVPEGYSHLALSADGTELAAVDPDGDGVSRWVAGARIEVPGLGARVSAPAYDRRGFLWAGAVRTSEDRLFVVDVRADPADKAAAGTPVVAPWLRGRRVVEVRIAAGGDRAAVLSTTMAGRDPRIDLAGIQRGDADRPQRLSAPLELGVGFSSARSLVWLDDRTLATVAGIRGSDPRPTIVGVGGDLEVLDEVPGAREVATTGGERNLFVLTDEGRLFVRSGPRWVDSGPADDLASAAG